MIIPVATVQTTSLDLIERSRYSFAELKKQIRRQDLGEPLVGRSVIEEAGILCGPFWETAGDLEGETYKSYILDHPLFDIALRQGVLKRLVDAQALVPKHWQIVIKAGYRPYEVQIALLESFAEYTKRTHPEWDKDEVLAYARTFVADPRITCPPHVTGGAVDVDIINITTSKTVDMGCPPNTDGEIAYLHSDLLTSQQTENRQVLLKAMLSAGFAPLAAEWWHYQYGETNWAAFYGHKHTKYDVITV